MAVPPQPARKLRSADDDGAGTRITGTSHHQAPAPARLSNVPAGRVAIAALIVGVGLLVFANARAAHAVGVASLLLFVVTGFLALAPALLP